MSEMERSISKSRSIWWDYGVVGTPVSLTGMWNCKTMLGIGVVVFWFCFFNVKHTPTPGPSYSTPRCLSKRNKRTCPACTFIATALIIAKGWYSIPWVLSSAKERTVTHTVTCITLRIFIWNERVCAVWFHLHKILKNAKNLEFSRMEARRVEKRTSKNFWR